jgi:Cys-tRNA(Pro)/Cys-tRNA(Cys) deacylase
MEKTNVIRLLEGANISYEPLFFDPETPGFSFDQILASAQLSRKDVFKTLVAKGNRTGVLVAVLPLDKHLDYKALAKASGNKKVTMLPLKDLHPTTGYVRGGCSPIGMKGSFPVFFDQTFLQQEIVYINAGERGKLIGVSPSPLVAFAKGKVVPHLGISKS